MLDEVEEVEEEVIAKERNITTTTSNSTTSNSTSNITSTTASLLPHPSKTREEHFEEFPTVRAQMKLSLSLSDLDESGQPTKKMFTTFQSSLVVMFDTSFDAVRVYFVPLVRIVNSTTTNNTATLLMPRFQSIDRGWGSNPIPRNLTTTTAFVMNYEIKCVSMEEVSHAQHQNRVMTEKGSAAAFQEQLSQHGMNVTINEITPLPSLPPLRPRVSLPPPAIQADNTTSLMRENISNSVGMATDRMSALQKELKKTMEEEQYINQTAIQEEKEAAVLENHTVGSERKVRFALCYVKSPSRVRGPVVKSNL